MDFPQNETFENEINVFGLWQIWGLPAVRISYLAWNKVNPNFTSMEVFGVKQRSHEKEKKQTNIFYNVMDVHPNLFGAPKLKNIISRMHHPVMHPGGRQWIFLPKGKPTVRPPFSHYTANAYDTGLLIEVSVVPSICRSPGEQLPFVAVFCSHRRVLRDVMKLLDPLLRSGCTSFLHHMRHWCNRIVVVRALQWLNGTKQRYWV